MSVVRLALFSSKSARFALAPIGIVRCSYTETPQTPSGLSAQHDAEGMLDRLPVVRALPSLSVHSSP
jgi:hypothetical protein